MRESGADLIDECGVPLRDYRGSNWRLAVKLKDAIEYIENDEASASGGVAS